MAAQERFRIGSGGDDRGLELGDDTSATDDRVSLTAVLYTVEQVSETPRRLSCSYFNHNIRLSDARPRCKQPGSADALERFCNRSSGRGVRQWAYGFRVRLAEDRLVRCAGCCGSGLS
jgi:hypothetical protein